MEEHEGIQILGCLYFISQEEGWFFSRAQLMTMQPCLSLRPWYKTSLLVCTLHVVCE